MQELHRKPADFLARVFQDQLFLGFAECADDRRLDIFTAGEVQNLADVFLAARPAPSAPALR